MIIGDGAAIGARAVLAKDIPSYHIAVGNPVTETKSHFNDEQTKSLCSIKWWDWPIERIEELTHLLSSLDIEKFIQLVAKN